MDDLILARSSAELLRFNADLPDERVIRSAVRGGFLWGQYHDALEINSTLTPRLDASLSTACSRLNVPRRAVVAFVYSSPELQASCIDISDSACAVRFSSGMLDLLSVEEFEFVVGHEIGHFLLRHEALSSTAMDASSFAKMRSQEISADRIGFLASGSLDVALRAIMKTVSGLNERHLRYDVSAFVSQLQKVEGPAVDFAQSTHPSMALRAKALLWISMAIANIGDMARISRKEIDKIDARVKRDLHRFIDSAVKREYEEAKESLVIWTLAAEIIEIGHLSKVMQTHLRSVLSDASVDSLVRYLQANQMEDLRALVGEKFGEAKATFARLDASRLEGELLEAKSKARDLRKYSI